MEKHCNKEGKNKLSKSPLRMRILLKLYRVKNKARNTLEVLGMEKLLQIHSVWDNENTTEDLIVNASTQNDDDNENDDTVDHNSHETESSYNSSDLLVIIKEVCLDM